jgi:hypothetical protein
LNVNNLGAKMPEKMHMASGSGEKEESSFLSRPAFGLACTVHWTDEKRKRTRMGGIRWW